MIIVDNFLWLNDRNEPGRPVCYPAVPSGTAASGAPSCLSSLDLQSFLPTVPVAARTGQM